MTTSLVIGGGGFIGTHLVRYLCTRGSKVDVIDRAPSEAFRTISSPLVSCTEIDLHDDAELTARVRKSSVIFHLAAEPSVEICREKPLKSVQDNFLTSVKVMAAVAATSADQKPRNLVFTSTSSVYGDVAAHLPISEETPTIPLSNYGKDKLRSEDVILKAAHAQPGFRCCVLRLFNVYGSGQKKNSPYSGVITRFLEAYLTEQSLHIHGSGEQIRDFVHVQDVVQAIHLAGQSSGFPTPLNVSTGTGVTINGLAELFRRRKNLPVKRGGTRVDDIFFSVGDCSKIRGALNWVARVKLQQGIKELITEAEKQRCEL
jgi:UDP-glucose 4-epimerase